MDNNAKKQATVYVCTNLRTGRNSCAQRKSKAILGALQSRCDAQVKTGGAWVEVLDSVCMGYCDDGPNVKIVGGALLHGVGVDDVDAILHAAETIKRD